MFTFRRWVISRVISMVISRICKRAGQSAILQFVPRSTMRSLSTTYNSSDWYELIKLNPLKQLPSDDSRTFMLDMIGNMQGVGAQGLIVSSLSDGTGIHAETDQGGSKEGLACVDQSCVRCLCESL